MNPTSARALHKLNLIRVLASHPQGLPIETLGQIMGYSSLQQLKKQLGELYMIESYPYSPMDCVEVEFDGTLVSLRTPIPIEKSIPLSPLEWITLRNIIDDSLSVSDSKSSAILHKLRDRINSVLPTAEWSPHPEQRNTLIQAIESKSPIQFLYWKRNSQSLENKQILPLSLVEEGESYVFGYDLNKKSLRSYRLDFLTSLQILQNVPSDLIPKDTFDSNSLPSFLNETKESVYSAKLFATESASFHLSRKVDLQKTGIRKQILEEDYYECIVQYPEVSWFLDLVLGYGKSVFVQEPASLRQAFMQRLGFA